MWQCSKTTNDTVAYTRNTVHEWLEYSCHWWKHQKSIIGLRRLLATVPWTSTVHDTCQCYRTHENAVINGSGVALKTASNFFEYRMGSFTTGYNFLKELYKHKKKWIITKCIEKNNRAGVMMQLQSTTSVIVCMLKRKDSCWRIRKIYEMSSESSALHMITMKMCK